MKEFSMAEYDGSPIIIYGASVFGEYTLSALRRHGIEPVCFCDRKKSGEIIHGVSVRGYSDILELKNAVVLLAVGEALKEVRDFMLENAITNVFSIYRFVFEENNWDIEQISEERRDIYYFKHLYRFALEKLKNGEGIFHIDFVITEKCSLRCRDCSNLMQYYEMPCNYGVAKLQENLDRLLSVTGKIFDLRILGGEPFMNPMLPEIIEKYLDDDRIVNITIFTNATILPKEETMRVLRHRKVKCQISNYGEIAKNFNRFAALMENEEIRHTITEIGLWHDLGKLEDRKKTEEEMTATFAGCECNNLPTLLHDKIYRCPFSAHGRNLDAIPDMEEDRVQLCGSGGYTKKKLYWMLNEKKFDYACGYCNGRGGGSIKPAIQSDKPLAYRRCRTGGGEEK